MAELEKEARTMVYKEAERERNVIAVLEKKERTMVCKEAEEEKLLDFNTLCSKVAMQTSNYGNWRILDVEEGENEDDEYGVLRMWEGDLFGCSEDQRIALDSICCPCYRFGKNMRRAGFGSCITQGFVYLILAVTAFLNIILYMVTKKHCFLFLGAAFVISLGAYLGFYRTQIRKKFNIMNSDSSIDDCIYHMICPCCALSQESRTLEMNNVQDGIWHGRGDTICIGRSYGEGSKAFFELSPPPIMSTKSNEPYSMQNMEF
ncbi:hypothetical protein LguiA_025280 [Lonicera macranthoides]